MSPQNDIFSRNRRTQRLGRHFQHMPLCRPEAVRLLAEGGDVPDASSQEQAAAIALLCAVLPFDEVLQRLAAHPLEGSGGSLTADFFPVLEANVAALDLAGLDHSAADLLRVGEMLAETHQQAEVAERYRRLRTGRTISRLRGMPFLKQRGH